MANDIQNNSAESFPLFCEATCGNRAVGFIGDTDCLEKKNGQAWCNQTSKPQAKRPERGKRRGEHKPKTRLFQWVCGAVRPVGRADARWIFREVESPHNVFNNYCGSAPAPELRGLRSERSRLHHFPATNGKNKVFRHPQR